MRPIPRLPRSWRTVQSPGFTLVELLAYAAVILTLVAFILPFTRTTLNAMNLISDARNVSGATALAKMRAAAHFTQARVFVSLTGRSFHVERWQKTAPVGWVTEGIVQQLSSTVNFGFGTLTTPPPDTQAALGQASPCLDAAAAPIADTACIVFNSRGVPVDAANAPTSAGALYVNDGRTIYGVTTTAGGMIQLWQNNLASMTWTLR
jgi:hypothetical protein